MKPFLILSALCCANLASTAVPCIDAAEPDVRIPLRTQAAELSARGTSLESAGNALHEGGARLILEAEKHRKADGSLPAGHSGLITEGQTLQLEGRQRKLLGIDLKAQGAGLQAQADALEKTAKPACEPCPPEKKENCAKKPQKRKHIQKQMHDAKDCDTSSAVEDMPLGGTPKTAVETENAQRFIKEAERRFANGDLIGAIWEYDQATDINAAKDSVRAEAFAGKAVVYVRLNRLAEATAATESARSCDSKNATYLRTKAWLNWVSDRRNLTEVESLLNQSLEIEPLNADALHLRAQAYRFESQAVKSLDRFAARNKATLAANDLTKALGVRDTAGFWADYAVVLMDLGENPALTLEERLAQLKAASTALSKAQSRDPRLPGLPQNESRLVKLKAQLKTGPDKTMVAFPKRDEKAGSACRGLQNNCQAKDGQHTDCDQRSCSCHETKT